MKGGVTVVITNRNGEEYLEECINSVKGSTYPVDEIIVTDNASEDSSIKLLEQRFPDVKVLAFQNDIGHSGACARGIEEARTRYVLILDNDTKVDKDWLYNLMEASAENPGGTIYTSRIFFYNSPDTLHCDGGYAHYIGSMILLNGFKKYADLDKSKSKTTKEIGAAGTVSMLIDKEKIKKVGSFDESFYIYLNDFEFALRARLGGGKIFSVPKSIVYHKGGSKGQSFRGAGKYPPMRAFYIFRNRWLMILKLYSVKTLIICLPSLLVYEAVLIMMAATKGLLLVYIKAIISTIKLSPGLLKKRKEIQKIRKISDRELLTAAPLSLVPGAVKGVFQKKLLYLLDSFLIWYWERIKLLI